MGKQRCGNEVRGQDEGVSPSPSRPSKVQAPTLLRTRSASTDDHRDLTRVLGIGDGNEPEVPNHPRALPLKEVSAYYFADVARKDGPWNGSDDWPGALPFTPPPVKIINYHDGSARSFNWDGMLAIFVGDSQ